MRIVRDIASIGAHLCHVENELWKKALEGQQRSHANSSAGIERNTAASYADSVARYSADESIIILTAGMSYRDRCDLLHRIFSTRVGVVWRGVVAIE